MDFLGIGPLELIVVLVIAFIVVGPERLPELARSLSKTLRDVRAMSQGLTSEWQREIEGLSQIGTGEGLQKTLTKPFKEAGADLQKALTEPLGTGEGLQETLTKPFKEAGADLQKALTEPLGTGEGPQETSNKPFKEDGADLEKALTEPLDTGEGPQETSNKPFKEDGADPQQAPSPSPTSSSDATAEPAPLEASPPKQPNTLNGDVENVKN